MAFLKSLVATLGQFLALYGGWGLLGISFLDSSFVPLPGLNDLLLLHLSSRQPDRAFVYALASTFGSVAGAYVMYGMARGGAQFLWRPSSPAFQRVRHWLGRNDFASVLVVSLLPPPTPFKIFLLAAGTLRVNAVRFGVALLAGRGLRFGAAAFLGAHYGAQAEGYLKENLVGVSLLAALLVVLWTVLYRRLATHDIPMASKDDSRSSPSAGS
mgnify:CR=1 FL=1